jgi:hypothetical protein
MNWDLLSQTYPEPILEAISSRKPVITEAYMLPDVNNPEQFAEYEAWKEWFRSYVAPGDDPGAPAVDIEYVWPLSPSVVCCFRSLTQELHVTSNACPSPKVAYSR